MPDDLSLGPVAATEDRAAWSEREMGLAWSAFDRLRCGFSSLALDRGRRRVAWWCWRAAQEYCGFLQFVWRLGDEPCDAIDLSDAPVVARSPGRGGVAETLAPLSPEQIVASGLIDRAEPLTREGRAAWRGRWSRLRAEDAPLRVPTGGGGISSAPIFLFDDALVRGTTDRWRPTARTVAEVLDGLRETRLHQAGDFLLAARVHALAEAGRIELRGGDSRRGVAGTGVRLPVRAPSPAAPP